jgi:hypothetical protein
MATPNLLASTQILGKTTIFDATTTLSNVIVNPESSGNLVKIDTLTISNYGTSAISSNVILRRGAARGYIAGTANVAVGSTLTVIARDTALFLEEGDYLQANVSANSTAQIVMSYEVIT